MILRTSLTLAATLVALSAAGAVQAEVAKPSTVLKPYHVETGRSGLDLAEVGVRRASTFDQGNALRAAGIARTSLDRRFGKDEVTGSFGFLCGLQPSRDYSGAGTALGEDPHGRFVGAKLSRAF